MAEIEREKLFAKIKRNLHKLGKKPVLEMLSLYYLAKDKSTPLWVLAMISGCFAYFILPVDGIADFLPLGFADDLAVLTATYKKVQTFITDKHRLQAQTRYQKWFAKDALTGESKNGVNNE